MNYLITFLASFLIWLMFAGLFVLWVIDGKIKKEQVLHALFSTLAAWLIAQTIKSVFPIDRPFEIHNLTPMTFLPPVDGAFPSSHTAVAFSLAASLWLHDKRVGAIYLVSAGLLGIARVLGNVHYPIDILGGAILGCVVALMVERLHFRT